MSSYRKARPYRTPDDYRSSLPPTQRFDAIVASRCPFAEAPKRRTLVAAGWRHAPTASRRICASWSHAPAARANARLPFRKTPAVRGAVKLPWRAAPGMRSSAPRLPFARPDRALVSAHAPWSRPSSIAIQSLALPWRHPPAARRAIEQPWGMPPSLRARDPQLAWRHPPRLTLRARLPWQHAPVITWKVHVPGEGVHPPHEPPGFRYISPPGYDVHVAFQCPAATFSGRAVPVPFGPAACYVAWPRPRVYIVNNSAGVVRLPERTPIYVSSIGLQQGVDDVHWSMRMALADPAHLELLKPDAGGPKVVEITINGYVWTAIVDAFQQDRAHPGRAVSVSGRSQTALLDAPYAPQRSFVQTADRLLQQLIDDELSLTGFTADYSAVAAQTGVGGWIVPSGVYHYDAQTAIASVRTLAAASGAIARAHPWDKVIVVQPRYAASPWAWDLTAPDKQIQDDIILRDSLRLVSKPLYDYVLVSGEQMGVSDPIVRDGEAGTTRASMVVDPLITDHVASRERGRNVLSDRGEQAAIDVTIPLFEAAVTDQPGLVLPLQLVEVIEPTSWKGLATSVSISAESRDVDGRSVLVVDQTITLERHYSDAG